MDRACERGHAVCHCQTTSLEMKMNIDTDTPDHTEYHAERVNHRPEGSSLNRVAALDATLDREGRAKGRRMLGGAVSKAKCAEVSP